MTIREAILDLFIACGAQELSDIVYECSVQVRSNVTTQEVLHILNQLCANRTIRQEVISVGDQSMPSFTAWGFPSDF